MLILLFHFSVPNSALLSLLLQLVCQWWFWNPYEFNNYGTRQCG